MYLNVLMNKMLNPFIKTPTIFFFSISEDDKVVTLSVVLEKNLVISNLKGMTAAYFASIKKQYN